MREFLGWALYTLATRIYPQLVDELLDDTITALNLAAFSPPTYGSEVNKDRTGKHGSEVG